MKFAHEIRRLSIACAVIATCAITACATETSSTPTTENVPAANTNNGNTLDAYNPAAESFYGLLRGPAMREVEHHSSLGEAVSKATAVVLGTVLRVEKTRDFQGEVPDDRFSYVGVVIQPEILAGTLEPRFQEALTVEFKGDETLLAELKRLMPAGHQALWFLRHKHDAAGQPGFVPVEAERDYFRTVSSQGLFVQGSGAVTAPLAEMLPGARNLATEGASHQRLSALVAKVRELAAAR